MFELTRRHFMASAALLAPSGEGPRHVTVFRQAGSFAGWPANHGIWSWGNEIVVGFEVGVYDEGGGFHAISRKLPAVHKLARSLDGGETWTIEEPKTLQPPAGSLVADIPAPADGPAMKDCPGGVDFTRPGFALTLRMENINTGPSRFYYSYDKGKVWAGPFRFPELGLKGIAARTGYLVNGKSDCMAFLTAAKSNGREGRVFMARTTDGAKTWKFVSYVTPEPEGRDFAIMPGVVRLGKSSILVGVRYREWIDMYRSDDNGTTWRFVSKPVTGSGSNPPAMVRLADGRVALTYGRRVAPFGVRARFSSDEGVTWSDELVLRDDAAKPDLGYCRSVVRPDGKIVTAYYYNDAKSPERYIAATIYAAPK